METGDDTAHFQATIQGLSVPLLMCRRTEGTVTTDRRCCGVFLVILAHSYSSGGLVVVASQHKWSGADPAIGRSGGRLPLRAWLLRICCTKMHEIWSADSQDNY